MQTLVAGHRGIKLKLIWKLPSYWKVLYRLQGRKDLSCLTSSGSCMLHDRPARKDKPTDEIMASLLRGSQLLSD